MGLSLAGAQALGCAAGGCCTVAGAGGRAGQRSEGQCQSAASSVPCTACWCMPCAALHCWAPRGRGPPKCQTRPLLTCSAGQYVRIMCPNISALEWHPFTISSAPGEPPPCGPVGSSMQAKQAIARVLPLLRDEATHPLRPPPRPPLRPQEMRSCRCTLRRWAIGRAHCTSS